MPVYEYFCEKCQKAEDIHKSFDMAETVETHECGAEMRRLFSTPHLGLSVCRFEPHHNWSLGQKFSTKTQMSEAISRYEGETGRKLYEVGNDNLKSIKPKLKSYDDI